MGFLTILLCFVIAVLPFIQGHTPEYFARMGYPMGIQEQQMGQPMGTFGAGVETPMVDVSPVERQGQGLGRPWCTCRRRCRYSETPVRRTCPLPQFYPRYWYTCCKYLRNDQTSSMYRGIGGSGYPTYPQIYPAYPQSDPAVPAKAVLPFIQSTTPGYFARMRQGIGSWNNRRHVYDFWGTGGGQSRGSAYLGPFWGTGGGRTRGSAYPGAFWGTRGAQSRESVNSEDQYRTVQGQSVESGYGASWCTCRRRCSRPEIMVVRNNCLLPSYIRSWHTCCKYLNTYQTSSIYRGSGSASVSSQRNSQRRDPFIGALIPGTTAPKGF
ncbi:Hypothetical predicted protein [Mytilus galloprovincialis]|uniref:Uncharacterized protein n=1 Tax=Mytilus galloprovincialis TaxID=29158 RepID=A0A8B6ELY7_MYTGA|nr:Hypothetical predicted protein [Mytilus galloprovincialis]